MGESQKKSLVFLRSVKERQVEEVVEELLEAIGWRDLIGSDTKVAIKPNLCCEIPAKMAGANTDRRILDTVCRVVSSVTSDISICESNGTRYKADVVFEEMKLEDMTRDYGVKVVNLSDDEKREIDHPLLTGNFAMPVTLLDADLVIDLPVLKTHALTVFTGGVKNLWGCVPAWDRILLHRYLDQLLSELIGILKPRLNIMDGILCMEGRGPVNGVERRKDIILASRDVVALDASAMRLVGLDPYASRHLVLSGREGHGELDESKIELDGAWAEEQCEFDPAVNDWALRGMNYLTRFPFFTYKILLNNNIFYPVKRLVQALRKIAVVR